MDVSWEGLSRVFPHLFVDQGAFAQLTQKWKKITSAGGGKQQKRS